MVIRPVDHLSLKAVRATWLESGLDADLPLVDAHHHDWDLARNPHPWLQRQPRLPFRYGDYAAIGLLTPPLVTVPARWFY